ncbi:MAG: hypothetical protein JXQ27_03180 [Acidobacteria bacterium]|nr:hypothetical protein [Acidobacteriota bacterium]
MFKWRKLQLMLLLTAIQAMMMAGPAISADDDAAAVTATLLADTTAIQAGTTFRLGVLFRMAPEWHIYWLNPGDAGLSTAIEFVLPEGFTAEPLRWPTPIRFVQPGDITGYGYDGEVLLWADITPPPTLPTDQTLPLKAEVSWLSCKDKCVMGQAAPTLALPVGEARPSAAAATFTRWMGRLPERLAPGTSGDGVSWQMRWRQEGAEWRAEVDVRWDMAPVAVECYPAVTDTLLVRHRATTLDGPRSRIDLDVALQPAVDPTDLAADFFAVIRARWAAGDEKAFQLFLTAPPELMTSSSSHAFLHFTILEEKQ